MSRLLAQLRLKVGDALAQLGNLVREAHRDAEVRPDDLAERSAEVFPRPDVIGEAVARGLRRSLKRGADSQFIGHDETSQSSVVGTPEGMAPAGSLSLDPAGPFGGAQR